MTVTAQTTEVKLAGNGIQTAFAYSFQIPFQSDGATPAVIVTAIDAAGAITTKINGVDYTITGVGGMGGGVVTMTVAPASGTYITIQRNLFYTQPTAVNNTAFYPHYVETGLDTVEQQIQQLVTKAGRSVVAPPGETLGQLPSASARAGLGLGFDSSGNLVTLPVVTMAASTANSYVQYVFNATAGQTTFVASYNVGIVQVFVNGVLLSPADYTASNGTTVVLARGCIAGDVVLLVAYTTFAVSGAANQSLTNATFTAPHTGASALSVVNKLDQWVYHNDYGAAYDGVTNDTASLTAAANAAVSKSAMLMLGFGTTLIGSITLPAVTHVEGQGIGATTIKLVRGSYTLGTSILNISNTITLRNLSIDCDDASLSNIVPLAFVTGANVICENVSINGQFYQGVLFYNCTNFFAKNLKVNSTNIASSRGIQIDGCTGGMVLANYMTGNYASHILSVNNSTGVSVIGGNYRPTTTTSGFGISFTYATGCLASHNYVANTTLEAIEMTTSTDCTMAHNYGIWDDSHGSDFAMSIDGCLRCTAIGNHFVNSYGSGIGIASDSAISQGNKVIGNTLTNCSARGNVSGLQGRICSLIIYSSTYSQTNNEVAFNTCHLDSGKTVTWLFQEQQNASATTGNNTIRGNLIVGAGTYTNTYSYILSAGTRIWHDAWETWTPTWSAQSGTITAMGTVLAKFQRQGPVVNIQVDAVMTTNGSAAGSVIFTLPISTPISNMLHGRENALTGASITGVAAGTTCTVRNYTNGYPGGTGAELLIGGFYQPA